MSFQIHRGNFSDAAPPLYNQQQRNSNNTHTNNDGNPSFVPGGSVAVARQPIVEVQSSWTETAYDWMQRSRRKRALAMTPRDPTSAAWYFVRPGSADATVPHTQQQTAAGGGGTGIAFIDAALRRHHQVAVPSNHQNNNNSNAANSLPVIDLRGQYGKTWTLLSLASRFVVATRPSQFKSNHKTTVDDEMGEPDDDDEDRGGNLPQVIILDSQRDMTTSKLAYVVRSTLLRKIGTATTNLDGNALKQRFEQDMEDCLSRIHIATVDSVSGWIPILESIRCQLAPLSADHPTLILWDGFLSEMLGSYESVKMEIVRQLELVLQECSVFLVTTTSTNRKRNWERFITQRIRLDRNIPHIDTVRNNNSTTTYCNNNTQTGHEYMATVHGSQIPFSISLAGILS